MNQLKNQLKSFTARNASAFAVEIVPFLQAQDLIDIVGIKIQ